MQSQAASNSGPELKIYQPRHSRHTVLDWTSRRVGSSSLFPAQVPTCQSCRWKPAPPTLGSAEHRTITLGELEKQEYTLGWVWSKI